MAVLRLIQGAAGAANVTRDAHEIVVGQSSAPYNDGVDDADFLDPGDGTGLEAALAAAGALGHGADVRLRNCEITLDPNAVTLPLSIPQNVRLIGAGRALEIAGLNDTGSRIVGPDQDDQRMFTMGQDASIENMAIVSPNPTAATSGANAGIVECTARCRFHQVNFSIDVDQPENTPRSQGDAIRSDSTEIEVVDCLFAGDKQAAQQGGGAPLIRGLVVLNSASSTECLVDRCRFVGIDQGIVTDADRFYVSQSRFLDLASSSFRTTLASNTGKGIALVGCFMQRDDVLYGPGVPKEVIVVDNSTGVDAEGGRIVGCEVDGTSGLGQGGGGIIFSSTGGGALNGAIVEACAIENFDFAVRILQAVVDGTRVTGNTYRNITGGAFVADSGSNTILDLSSFGRQSLGGGGTATLGTVGGNGPTTTAQDSWVEVEIQGTRYFVPLWQ